MILEVAEENSVSDERSYTDVVELLHGQHKVHVHKNLLCSLSGYVAKLAGEHLDSETISLNVNAFSPQLDKNTLARFVNWIYRNQLYDKLFEDSFLSRCGELINLYILARRWDIDCTQECDYRLIHRLL